MEVNWQQATLWTVMVLNLACIVMLVWQGRQQKRDFSLLRRTRQKLQDSYNKSERALEKVQATAKLG